MTKSIWLTLLLSLPFIASADAVNSGGNNQLSDTLVPIENCNASNADRCAVLPVHQEIDLKDAVKKVNLGTVYLTSKPVKKHNRLIVQVSATIQCDGQTEKKPLIRKTTVCGFPEARTEVNKESDIFKLVHDPILSLTEENHSIILRYKNTGKNSEGYCGDEDRIVVVNPCLPPVNPSKHNADKN